VKKKREIRAIEGFKVIHLLLIELFSLDVTAESLRAKISRKSANSRQLDQFDPKFQVEGVVPTNHFCTDRYTKECLITVPLTVFTPEILGQPAPVGAKKSSINTNRKSKALSNEPKMIILRCPRPQRGLKTQSGRFRYKVALRLKKNLLQSFFV